MTAIAQSVIRQSVIRLVATHLLQFACRAVVNAVSATHAVAVAALLLPPPLPLLVQVAGAWRVALLVQVLSWYMQVGGAGP